MKKIIIIIIIAAIAIITSVWLIKPMFINKEVNESLPQIQTSQNPPNETNQSSSQEPNQVNSQTKSNQNNEKQNEPIVIGKGIISGESGHSAEGTVTLIEVNKKKYVRFKEDFNAENGPDLFVHLGKNNQYDRDINLGKLKGNIGSQNYEIPSNINLNEYDEIWIWCRAFAVPFAKAEIEKN